MKKLIALLLALVMVLSLAACAGDTPPTEGNDPQPTQGEEHVTTPAPTDPPAPLTNAERYPLETDTVLRIVWTDDGVDVTDASALWEEVTGVKTETLTWNNEQLMTSLASGDIPDALWRAWNMSRDKVYEYGAAGKFLDFSKHLDKMPNLSRLIEEYPEIMDVCTYPDGAMYSLPCVIWSNTGQGNLFYIRTDMLAEMGWDHTPATTDEFLTFIKEAQAKYGADNPEFKALHPYTKNYMRWNAVNSLCYTLFPSFGDLIEPGLTLDSNDKVTLGVATEQYKHYLEFMHEIWESGAFETEVYTLDSAAAKASIQAGNCAISIGTTVTDGSIIDVLEPLTSEYQSEKRWAKNSLVSFSPSVVSASCKDLDTVLAWFDSFYAQEDDPLTADGTVWGYSISKGRLGVHWTKDDESMTWTSGESYSNYGTTLYGGNFTYAPTNSLRVKGTGTNEHLLPYAVQVSGLTALTLSEDDSDTYADIWTDMENYISQMHSKFITGEEDIEAGWDAYLKNLEKMGLEELLDIYQRTYDAK